jgi:hypothetical protein
MHLNINYQNDAESELPLLAEVLERKQSDHSITPQAAYNYLINIDEFPEQLPLCNHIVTQAISEAKECRLFPAELYNGGASLDSISTLVEHLKKQSETIDYSTLLNSSSDKKESEFLISQMAPTMFVSGCWLQNLSRVATAHTRVAGTLNKLFCIHTMAYDAAETQLTDRIGEDLLNLFTTFRESRLSKESIFSKSTEAISYELPLLLLSIGQFPRSFLPELLGLNLAWHHLGIQSFLEHISLKNFLGSDLPEKSLEELNKRNATMAEMSLDSIQSFLNEQDAEEQNSAINRVICGMEILASAWLKLINSAGGSMPVSDPDPRAAVIEIMRSKGPHALGYHRDKKINPKRIDNLLDINEFDPSELVDTLAKSPFVVPGNADKSPLTTGLIEIGGPMAAVFSNEELEVIRNWINSLDSGTKPSPVNEGAQDATEANKDSQNLYPFWNKADFLNECSNEYANRPCSLREIFYKLVNIEYFPDILPVAENFLTDRLNRTRSTLTTGERPIPDLNYSYKTLEQWVFNKHRQQVDAYKPLTGEPRVSKEVFINSTVALAPLLLIDGGWLQGTTGVNTIHTKVGQKLYHIFFEEIGLGSCELHHSNIYRELLESMGVDLPNVADLDFAFSDQFPDSSFEVPILWLSLSCFSRHYYPELLGINLAVELAGLGANYMEAHDILKYYGLPTIFVDFHNSADNVSVGHTAWSLDAIKLYMDWVAVHEGPHNLDGHWHRIWSGMRLTLPSTSDFHWNPAKRQPSEQKIEAVPAAIF